MGPSGATVAHLHAGRKDDLLALDFVNTVACPGCRGSDPLDSLDEARRWFRRNGLSVGAPLGSRDVRSLRRLRTELRRLFASVSDGSPPPPAALRAVNRAWSRSRPRSVLRWVRGRWVLADSSTGGSSYPRLAALVAQSLADMVAGSPSLPVRRCQGRGCVHYLVAYRAQQRWCSPTGCGNRARVQRHYRRLRSRSSGS